MREHRDPLPEAPSDRRAWVHEAVIALATDTDPRAVGAAVTVALCGHWEHDGPCRWPHNNEITSGLFRTLFVCTTDDVDEVRRLISGALATTPQWQLVSERDRPVADSERALAADLLRVPRRL